VQGLTFGVLTTAKGTICAEMIPHSRRAEGLSYFAMSMSLAMVLGPYVGLQFADREAFTLGFVANVAIAVVAVALTVVLRVPPKEGAAHAAAEKRRFSLDDLFDRKALPFSLATIFAAVAYSGVLSFLALYTKDMGLKSTASNFFLIYAGFIMISRPFTGRWADRFGAKFIIYPCLLLFAVSMFMISTTHANAVFLVAGAILGVAYGSLQPILQTQVISAVEPQRVGVANSLYFNSIDTGTGLGSYLMGLVANGWGYQTIYYLGLALVFVVAAEYFLLTRRHGTASAADR